MHGTGFMLLHLQNVNELNFTGFLISNGKWRCVRVCVEPNFMIFIVGISLRFYVDLITMNLPAVLCGIAFSIRFPREETQSTVYTRMYTHDNKHLE